LVTSLSYLGGGGLIYVVDILKISDISSSWSLKMGPIGFLKIFVTDYQSILCKSQMNENLFYTSA
jgi:hypothetical protein